MKFFESVVDLQNAIYFGEKIEVIFFDEVIGYGVIENFCDPVKINNEYFVRENCVFMKAA